MGCVVDSCFGCRACADLEEQYCSNGMVGTYGSITKYGRHGPNGAQTHGGYSDAFVVNERFAFKLPRGVDLAKAAPLLCAGITTYDPLVKLGCGLPASGRPEPKKRVGIVGLGGLGGVGVKIAKSFGCDVVAFSSTAAKRDDAFAIGASDFVLNTDAERMKALAKEVADAPPPPEERPIAVDEEEKEGTGLRTQKPPGGKRDDPVRAAARRRLYEALERELGDKCAAERQWDMSTDDEDAGEDAGEIERPGPPAAPGVPEATFRGPRRHPRHAPGAARPPTVRRSALARRRARGHRPDRRRRIDDRAELARVFEEGPARVSDRRHSARRKRCSSIA